MGVSDSVEAHAYVKAKLCDHELHMADAYEITISSCEVWYQSLNTFALVFKHCHVAPSQLTLTSLRPVDKSPDTPRQLSFFFALLCPQDIDHAEVCEAISGALRTCVVLPAIHCNAAMQFPCAIPALSGFLTGITPSFFKHFVSVLMDGTLPSLRLAAFSSSASTAEFDHDKGKHCQDRNDKSTTLTLMKRQGP